MQGRGEICSRQFVFLSGTTGSIFNKKALNLYVFFFNSNTMSIFTTPLQIGYFTGLLFAFIFWYRSYREERHSDLFLGFVVFFLAMQLQDYTFGFAGINVLWEEMNGFPRHFGLAFAPTVYFYLQAQVNRSFRFKKRDFIHYLPYFIYFTLNMLIFIQGKKVVDHFFASPISYWLEIAEMLILWLSYIYYFYHSLNIYFKYRIWAENQFSNQNTIRFLWLRNFIYLIIAGEIFKLIWFLADHLLVLHFEQDWWWQLFTVSIVLYAGIEGYAQVQPTGLMYLDDEQSNTGMNMHVNETTEQSNSDSISVGKMKADFEETDYSIWAFKIEKIMEDTKPYLEPELSLSELAKRLKTNASIVSATINQHFGKNFNDFINEYRVKEFIIACRLPQNRRLTLLAIAYDCGFNSKATFNRAVKKSKGVSPRDFVLAAGTAH